MRGRPPNSIKAIAWGLQIPAPLAEKVMQRLEDPLTKEVAYGARSKLVAYLLGEWCKRQDMERLNEEAESDKP